MSDLRNDLAQRSGVTQSVITPKTIKVKDADETRRLESARDEEEGSSRPGGAKEQAGAQTAATFGADDKTKLKKKGKKRVGVGGPAGSKSARRTAQTGQTAPTAEQQGSEKTEGSRGRYGTAGGNYSAERSHQLATKHQLSQSSLTQASVKYEATQRAVNGNDANPLSAAGQRRMMLENLSRMVKIGLEQHTGGTAGEAYPRRETRQIFSALQGLKSGGQAAPTKETARDSRNVTNGEFKLKEQKMNNVLAIFLDPPAPPEGHEPLELVA